MPAMFTNVDNKSNQKEYYVSCCERMVTPMLNSMEKWQNVAEKAWAAILSRVEAMKAEGMTLQQISDIVGTKNRTVIGEWLNGNRKAVNATFSDMMKYLENLGFLPAAFFQKSAIPGVGDSNTPSICKPGHPPVPVSGDDLKTINVYDVAGAGPGVALSEVEPLFSVTAPPSYFRMSDYALKVSGHSMEPLIPHGAVVGVRLGAEFMANELFAARIPYEGLVIKRVGVDFARKEFVFKSQNPDKESYPDFRVGINEGEEIIVGRVVWVMVGY